MKINTITNAGDSIYVEFLVKDKIIVERFDPSMKISDIELALKKKYEGYVEPVKIETKVEPTPEEIKAQKKAEDQELYGIKPVYLGLDCTPHKPRRGRPKGKTGSQQ